MADDRPYLEIKIIKKVYNPDYGDDRECQCGHKYYRHFDTYEEMRNVGCKYCGCDDFVEMTPEKEKEIYDHIVESYNNAIENGYDLDSKEPIDVAFDMMDYDGDLPIMDHNYIKKLIIKYRMTKNEV